MWFANQRFHQGLLLRQKTQVLQLQQHRRLVQDPHHDLLTEYSEESGYAQVVIATVAVHRYAAVLR